MSASGDLLSQVVEATSLPRSSVLAVLQLLEDGCTVPFIARYRKEATGNLDEVQIFAVRDVSELVAEREKRRSAILASLKDNGLWSSELEKTFMSAKTIAELEDLYLPFRPRRKTRASVALEKGLAPLADKIGKNQEPDLVLLQTFIDRAQGIADPESALQGGKDILAERLNEAPQLRKMLRELLVGKGEVETKKPRSVSEDSEFRDFWGKDETLKNIPGHRFLALMRGVKLGEVSLKLDLDFNLVQATYAVFLNLSVSQLCQSLQETIEDTWKRLTQPSLETEVLKLAKAKADADAVKIFERNLRELLLAPPLGQKVVLGVDPGLRTGCKVAVLSEQGNLLDHSVIFPMPSFGRQDEAKNTIRSLVSKHKVQAVAIGNGTGGRETYDFFRELSLGLPLVLISESGASVYSASEIAREEFPELDLTVRGAISIGRRLMDPLSEFVKIDPKAIGVGQYQHDVDQKLLKKHLDDVVSSCVNHVGVDVNTATKSILTYVSGLNSKLADAFLEYRKLHGPFRARSDFLKVKGIKEKVFEQSAGFLRVRGGNNPLDASAVHPESYGVVEKIAKHLALPIDQVIGHKQLGTLLRSQNNWGMGLQTFEDLLRELQKPGQDPRREFENVDFDPQIRSLEDLKEGQILNGVVTNVTAFGAFVDVGVHQDG
ncbi:MAG: RNA-binding transcriptional accessory protein, partial [Spirochaetales bacterium]|nr:RNA-binding transcriptional accessory protein [Spirochaetales bacterium]